MKLLTKRDVIRSVADRWLAQYGAMIDRLDEPIGLRREIHGAGGMVIGTSFDPVRPSVVLARLRALDLETCTAADVDLVIGASSTWCELKCQECHEPVDQVVVLQAFTELDYVSHMAGTYRRDPTDPESWPREIRVCGPCVFAAFKLLESYR